MLQFELIDERYLIDHVVGKEDVMKVIGSAKKMIQHLDKVNINQKAMIMEHHKRTSELKLTSRSLVVGTIVKFGVILVVLIAQFVVVRKVFK